MMNANRTDELKAMLNEPDVPESLSPESVKIMLDKKTNKTPERKPVQSALKWTAAIAASAVLIGTGTYAARQLEEFSTGDILTTAGCFTSSARNYNDVYDYMKEFDEDNDDWQYNAIAGGGLVFGEVALGEAVAEEAVDGEAMEESTEAAAEYSGNTNDVMLQGMETTATSEDAEISELYNQETGVLESDIVRTDGRHIYSVQSMDNRFYINAAETEDGVFTDSYRISLLDYLPESVESGTVQAMYLKEGRLAVILDAYGRENSGDPIVWRTYVLTFSAGDSLELIGSYSQDGSFSDVRMMEDGTLYLVSCYDWYNEYAEENYKECIPEYYCGAEAVMAEPCDILLVEPAADDTAEIQYDLDSVFTNIGSLNILSDKPYESIDFKSLAGFSGEMYCTLTNIYLASPSHSKTEVPAELQNTRTNYITDFTRISIDSGMITPVASGSAAGRIKDQFSMSEYNGVFRAALTRVNYSFVNEEGNNAIVNDNAVYTFDLDMNLLGCADGFGLGEDIKSASFQGDLAYVVTFRQTDPLYSIDLSDPYDPVILDEYKITGYSGYMQQWSEGRLFGFGIAADEWGTELGLKLVMFDNSDPENLAEIDTAAILPQDVAAEAELKYEWGWVSSAAEGERKALLIAPERNLIAVPFACTMEYTSTNMVDTDFGYVLYSYSNNSGFIRSAVFYGQDQLNRAFYIDYTLYLIGADEMIAVDLNTMTENDRITF